LNKHKKNGIVGAVILGSYVHQGEKEASANIASRFFLSDFRKVSFCAFFNKVKKN